MNQGELGVVKQETARVNINILGIDKLKWTGMGEFNSEDHYIYYCGQESLRRNGVDLIINKRLWNIVLGSNLKNDRMILVFFQGKPFNITVIQLYVPITNSEVAEVDHFHEDLEDLLELTLEKMFFSSWAQDCKSRKPRDTWSNRQVWPCSTQWSKAMAHWFCKNN